MSWITGTQAETLSSNSAVGSAYANSSTVTVVSPPSGAAFLPANFFMPSYGQAKRVLVKASGVLSTTGTPNLTIAIPANTTQGTYSSSNVIATSAATAQGSGVTNIPWELEVMISCVAAGSSGTFLAMGMFRAFSSMTAGGGMRVSSSTANPNTAFTLSTQSAYYLELAATWGTANPSNTLTVYDFSVLGLN